MDQRHTSSPPPADVQRALEDYRQLAAKRRTLEEIVRVTQSIERLHSGLQAVVLMGKPNALISNKALRYFQELNESTRLQPTAKLRATLAHLEERMRQNLQRILQIAVQQSGRPLDERHDDDTANLINEFRRTSQTAVALRILLKDRGEATKPSVLPVEQSLLRQSIDEIATREKRCRDRVEGDIGKMQEDARHLLTLRSLPPPMRNVVEDMVANLQENLDHVRAGKSIESLPHPIEVIEMAEEVAVAHVPRATIPTRPNAATTAGAPDDSGERGFFGRLNEWLNTPWKVAWRDIKKTDEAEKREHGDRPAGDKKGH